MPCIRNKPAHTIQYGATKPRLCYILCGVYAIKWRVWGAYAT